MTFAYYANEIPLAKLIIRNYLILRCYYDEDFISYCRVSLNRLIASRRRELFIELYKQYLDTLDYFASPTQRRHVSCTVFKSLLARERRILNLVYRRLNDYQSRYSIERQDIIELIRSGDRNQA